MRNRSILYIALATSFLLTILLLLNLFSDAMDWGVVDFAFAGILLFGAGLSYEFLAKKMGRTVGRVVVAIVIAILFLLIWAELAVGIFGTPFAGS